MFRLEVVLTKRDPNALVREHRYTEDVATLDVATSTADGLIARVATFDGGYRREKRLTDWDRHGKVTGLSIVYWSTEANTIVGFANVNEIN